jgi:hypothetical protein
MLFQRSVSQLLVLVITLAAATTTLAREVRAVNLRHSQQHQHQQPQMQRSLQTDANGSENDGTSSASASVPAEDNNTFLMNLLANMDVDVEFITVTTTNNSTNSTNSTTGDALQEQQQQLELEPNVLFRLFYQSWMTDTNFSTVDAICAAVAVDNNDAIPVTSLSEVDDGDVSSSLAQAAAAAATASDTNACLLSSNGAADSDGAIGSWVCRTLYDPVSGIPSVSSVCAVPEITLATDQCGCCDNENNDNDNNSCPTPQEQRQQQCACPCNLGSQDGGTGGVLVQQQQSSTSTASPSSNDRCMRKSVAAARIAGNSERYTCVTTCAQAQQLERRRRQQRRTQANFAIAMPAMPDFMPNFMQSPDFINFNKSFDSLGSLIAGSIPDVTNTIGEGIIDAIGGNVSAGGSAGGFGTAFITNADGSPNTAAVGFATNSSSVIISSSITVTPAAGNNVNVGGNAIGNASDTADAIQDTVDANADAIQDSTDEFIDNLNNGAASTTNANRTIADIINDAIKDNESVVDDVVVPTVADSVNEVVNDADEVAATGDASGEVNTTTIGDITEVVDNVGSGLESAIGDAIGSVVGNFQDVIQDFRDTIFDQISNFQAAPNLNNVFDMNVPGFIGDIFNGIGFQDFLDSLPQQFPVANFGQDAPFGGILQAGESGSSGGFLYKIFYQNWVEETLFVDFFTCPAVENEPECIVNSQGDTGRWTCRTLFHPVSGTPKSFSICGDARQTLGTDQCGCCGGACPAACTCPCNLRGRGEGTGVLVKVGATLDSCMSPAMALKLTERNPNSFQCIDECSSI